MTETAETGELQLVVFQLGSESYGVDISQVREIVSRQKITRVPRTPYYIEGVMNLRGRVIPVVDLKKRLGLPQGEDPGTKIAVAEVEGITVGMVVDGVSEVLRISDAAVDTPSQVMAGIDVDYIIGVAKIEDRLVILLDLPKVLARLDKASEAVS